MPELPEVETVARDLRRAHLPGQTFTGVHLFWARTVACPDETSFRARLTGQTVETVTRRGKFLRLDLSGAETLLIHLRMTGRLYLAPASEAAMPHLRLSFDLGDGRQLRFHDMRKFGRVYLTADPDSILGKLGPEPLDETFRVDDLQNLLAGRKMMLKPLLLDQRFIAGIGNIYADEALFLAGLHPQRHANTLSPDEGAALFHALRRVLTLALENRGTTLDDYRTVTGKPGENQDSLLVFRQTGQPCPRCGRPIERLVVGGRGTHICPHCQPPGEGG
ncbi:MAG: bifunctional DNA-formamidopyrimidine glycosylase/DNA-(apurinic or apyrimidinic site) lyase [Chloroflexi bacterium]|nr:bifunctional DNA-formamidopyrimidine glycosylase/DNA-(apurinic or apyrimidinic site) lyase [Chloroflexota bacterium]